MLPPAARVPASLALVLTASLCGCAATPTTQYANYQGYKDEGWTQVFVSAGKSRFLDDESFPVGDENMFGIGLRGLAVSNQPVGIELTYSYREGEHQTTHNFLTTDFEYHTDELDIGLWMPFRTESIFHPSVGAGVSFFSVHAHRSGQGVEDSDIEVANGVYGHASLMIDLTRRVQVGVDVRYVFSSPLDLFGEKAHGQYGQALFVLGYSF